MELDLYKYRATMIDYMIRNPNITHFIMSLSACLIISTNMTAQESPRTGSSDFHEIQGAATNFLQPSLIVQNLGTNWYFELDFLAQTNFPQNAWLKITNRAASRLELWTIGGVKIPSRNPDTLGAWQLPTETTVSEIMSGVQQRLRVRQWLLFGLNKDGSYTTINHSAAVPNFDLGSAFDVSMTNDLILSITPLLYKVDTNLQSAHLTEFPPIKLKLLTNGNVQKIEGN
jgi:hypothetical protein